jgi:hypothetical protein
MLVPLLYALAGLAGARAASLKLNTKWQGSNFFNGQCLSFRQFIEIERLTQTFCFRLERKWCACCLQLCVHHLNQRVAP